MESTYFEILVSMSQVGTHKKKNTHMFTATQFGQEEIIFNMICVECAQITSMKFPGGI